MDPLGSSRIENPELLLPSMMTGRPEGVGEGRKHLKMRLRQRGRVVETIGFGLGGLLDDEELLSGKLDVAYHAGVNRWRGSTKVQIQVKALRPAGG